MGSTPRSTRKLPLDELFAQGEEVEGLLSHPGWKHLMGAIDAEVSQIDQRLDGHARPLEQAEYALAHGRRYGLLEIEKKAHAIVAHYRRTLQQQQERHDAAAEPVAERV
jgi:F0F1-type ATP synthase membrane subunit b/b'